MTTHMQFPAALTSTILLPRGNPSARFIQGKPLINVIAGSHRVDQVNAAENYRQSQFDAWDLLTGRQWPGLSGQESYLAMHELTQRFSRRGAETAFGTDSHGT